jgi:3-phosphoinositide dependent protein kinase-1
MSAAESTQYSELCGIQPPSTPPRSERSYARDDFEFGNLLGIGALAQVVHVRDNYSNNEYALKILDKKQLRRFGKVSQVINEKDMLLSLDHPGIVKLYFTFQDATWLYLALELCPNGDLSELISRKGRLPMHLVQYYAGELVNILVYLRKVGVAHRDIKPENLLISETGNLKLADFDTAKVLGPPQHHSSPAAPVETNRTNTFVGTAQYVSPEMLHDSAVAGFGSDLWALGCVVFQMLTGYPPFRASSEYLTFQRILATDYEFPSDVPDIGKFFVASLLALDPQDRLGFSDINDLIHHPFFESLCLDTLPDSPPPLDGVMRLRRSRRMARSSSGSSNDNFNLLDSSDEDELRDPNSQLLDDDEFMALFGTSHALNIAPASPPLVRSATTAPAHTQPNSSSCSECSDTGEGEVPPRVGRIRRTSVRRKIDLEDHQQPVPVGSRRRFDSCPARYVSSQVVESPGVQFIMPAGYILPRTMSTAGGASRMAWEMSSRGIRSSARPSIVIDTTLPRTETETSPIPTELSSPMVHSDIAPPFNNYLQRVTAIDERVLMSGLVLKRRFFGRNRILVVTDLPRLIVLESKHFRTVCEIPLLSSHANWISATEFSITSTEAAEAWHGHVRDGTAHAWVSLIQSLHQKTLRQRPAKPQHPAAVTEILNRKDFGCSDVVGSVSLFARGTSSDLPSSAELQAQAEARAEAALRLFDCNDPNTLIAACRTDPLRERKSSSSCSVM